MPDQNQNGFLGEHNFFLAELELCGESLQQLIKVGSDLRGLHPIVERERRSLRIGDGDFSRVPKNVLSIPRLNISVSKGLEKRALLIMDAVVKTAERLGFKFGESKDRWEKGLCANGYGFSLQFKLREPQKRKIRPPTDAEKADMKKYRHLRGPIYEMVPTGKLLLELDGPLGNASYSVKDGKTVRVEDGLNRFFWFAITEIDRVKRIWAEREREEQEKVRRQQLEKNGRRNVKGFLKRNRLYFEKHFNGNSAVYFANTLQLYD